MNRRAAPKQNAQILVVEDEVQFRRIIQKILISQGYEAWAARSGEEALSLIRSEKFDLVLLDLNLPGMNGIEVCRAIRAGFNATIIVLTVRDSQGDKLAAFDAGADDYVTKPFLASELLARIRAHLRRHGAAAECAPEIFQFADFEIDVSRRTITRRGERISLSPKQFQLLRYLISNRDKALSHRTLLQAVWGPDYGEETNLLHSTIAQLRKKVEADPGEPRHILTVPWFGYRFSVSGQE